MARIELEDLSLCFQVTRTGPVSPWDRIRRLVTGKLPSTVHETHALRNIDLVLAEGDRLGVVGHNGAGKSTLLKVIADIFPPGRGTRRVQGTISALFDFSLGFEVDATGWDNIAYRAYLCGDSMAQVRRKKQAVAEFSSLGHHLNLPVRYYSTGMKVRLAFAIATTTNPDILLIDEAFTAGDLLFRRKARNRLQELVARARIVISVSHELDLLAEFCDRVLWLDQGRIRRVGPSREVLDEYARESAPQAREVA
jgi:lipopolysaccharide transport system ATP-binding protein